jgi:hypothetical protein
VVLSWELAEVRAEFALASCDWVEDSWLESEVA